MLFSLGDPSIRVNISEQDVAHSLPSSICSHTHIVSLLSPLLRRSGAAAGKRAAPFGLCGLGVHDLHEVALINALA
jgi:hypothetical protein